MNVLSNHPRWMFKKNSMEFFIGLQSYLYYYYSGCTLKSYNHMFFPECSMTIWSCHMIWLAKFPCYLYLDPVVCFEVFGLSVWMHGKPFPVWGSHNTVLVSKDNERVSKEWDIKAARCRVDNGYQVLVLVWGHKDLGLTKVVVQKELNGVFVGFY